MGSIPAQQAGRAVQHVVSQIAGLALAAIMIQLGAARHADGQRGEGTGR